MKKKKSTKKTSTPPKVKIVIDKKRVSSKSIMEKELISLIKNIDEQGLLFLIKQAQIIIHNIHIDKINKNLETIQKQEQALPNKTTMNSSDKDSFKIESDKSSFIFVTNMSRKIFTLKEMRELVKICHAVDNQQNANKSIYRWFYNNRSDFLVDNKIGNESNSYLSLIYSNIKKSFKLKD